MNTQFKRLRTKITRTVFFKCTDLSKDFVSLFSSFGELSTVFVISTFPSVLFVTFYDIRSSERFYQLDGQRLEALYTLSHKELPKGNEKCDPSKQQGTLFFIFRNIEKTITGAELELELKKTGEIKSVRDYKGIKNQFFVEFYDVRTCEEVYRSYNKKPFLEGIIELRYIWDINYEQRVEIWRLTRKYAQEIEAEEEPIFLYRAEKIEKKKRKTQERKAGISNTLKKAAAYIDYCVSIESEDRLGI